MCAMRASPLESVMTKRKASQVREWALDSFVPKAVEATEKFDFLAADEVLMQFLVNNETNFPKPHSWWSPGEVNVIFPPALRHPSRLSVPSGRVTSARSAGGWFLPLRSRAPDVKTKVPGNGSE